MHLRGFLLIVNIVAAVGSLSFAGGNPESGGKPPTNPVLPITRVVLFSSGVGYFQRTGEVTGNETVELSVPDSAANDLLQSLVVYDGGGRITSIDYASQDPLARALKGFPIDLSDRPGIAEILSRSRGAEVSIRAVPPVTGVILGVESRRQNDGERLFLDLLGKNGRIRSVELDTVDEIRFLDPKLNRGMREALKLIASNRSTDTKLFSLRFEGSGTRQVAVSYLTETPVWKTSYRLSVDEGKPTHLQGWAIVDNPTDDDWNRVALDLVSGQPISFQMDLNRPVYNRRPTVAVPLPPSVTPQLYESGVTGAAESAAPSAVGGARPAPRAAAKSAIPFAEAAPRAADRSAPLSRGVEPAVRAAAVGESFRYSIATPITLPRHQSAMVPIVNQAIEAKPVAIYDESVLRSHPLSGLQLRNTTGLHLSAGPVTIFEGGVYAGDAQIDELPPDSTRLISYAVDLKTTVVATGSSSAEEISSVRIVHGSMIVTRSLERKREFEISSSASAPRTVLVVYPISAGWKLLGPLEPAERTADHYRFAVTTDPQKGGKASLLVRERRQLSQTVVLSNLDSRTILIYLSSEGVSTKVKGALRRLGELKNTLADLTSRQGNLESEINSVYKDQERIRANMRVLQSDSPLYQRYAATLGRQEGVLTGARESLAKLRAQITEARKRIDDFLSSLGEID